MKTFIQIFFILSSFTSFVFAQCVTANPDSFNLEATTSNGTYFFTDIHNGCTNDIIISVRIHNNTSGGSVSILPPVPGSTVPAGGTVRFNFRCTCMSYGKDSSKINIYVDSGDSIKIPVKWTCKTSSSIDSRSTADEKFSYEQNYPNPFVNTTTIKIPDSESGARKFEVRDMLGRVVYQTNVLASQTEISFDATSLPNGVYVYTVSDGKNVATKKIIVSK